MELTIMIICGGAFLCGGLIKGVVGMGLPLTAVALMTQFIELSIAVPLLVVPILATNAVQALRGRKITSVIMDFWSLIAPACVTTFYGVHLLYNTNANYLLAILGGAISIYGAINLFAIRVTINSRHKVWLSPFVGIAAGLMGGMTGVIAVPTIFYLQALRLTKDDFVQTLGVTFFIAGTFLLIALWEASVLDLNNIGISLLAMIPAILGMYVGEKLRSSISEEQFRNGVFIIIVIIGLNLIRKSLL